MHLPVNYLVKKADSWAPTEFKVDDGAEEPTFLISLMIEQNGEMSWHHVSREEKIFRSNPRVQRWF